MIIIMIVVKEHPISRCTASFTMSGNQVTITSTTLTSLAK